MLDSSNQYYADSDDGYGTLQGVIQKLWKNDLKK